MQHPAVHVQRESSASLLQLLLPQEETARPGVLKFFIIWAKQLPSLAKIISSVQAD